jgi:ATP-binding cassette subfamily B protein
MNIVQIFGSEKREFEKFKEINEDHKQANLQICTLLFHLLPGG